MIVSKEKLSQRKEFPMSTVGHSPKKRPGYLLGKKACLLLTMHNLILNVSLSVF